MCGIAALISLNGSSEHLTEIAAMTGTIRHRGPDDEGFAVFTQAPKVAVLFGGSETPDEVMSAGLHYSPKQAFCGTIPEDAVVALGHRRLSILDLSPAGHQPICTPDRRYWIAYNGEIYNYTELRAELEGYGHRFASHTDTEVIVTAYAQWGRDCLHRFNGMWAFVIYDAEEQKVFVARDRYGIKPLYYWFSPEGFLAIASEIKAFTILPGWKARLNGPRAYDYLVSNLLDHTRETLFQGVYQLPAGEAAEFRVEDVESTLPVYRWYRLEPQQFSGTFDAAAAEFRRLLNDSVHLRMRSDVPGGSCLSGGLDSSSIVCLVNDTLRSEEKQDFQKTFSACSHVKEYDEREFIDEVIGARDIQAHYTYPSFDMLLSQLDDLIWHQDEPFKTTSIFAQWLVFRLAAEQRVKVLLDGQGADEQLCGYLWFFGCRYADLFRAADLTRLWKEMQAVKSLHGIPETRSLAMMGYYLLPPSLKRPAMKYFQADCVRPSWINADLLAIPRGYLWQPNGSSSVPGVTQSIALAQMLYTSLPSLLHWEDRNSMAHSVESRVPFLDYRLVEFIMGLPEEYRIDAGVTKRVLREAMKGILPENVRMRMDKMGFYTAEEHWIRHEGPEIVRKLLREAVDASEGVLKEEAVERLDRMLSGEEPVSPQVWRWICFGQWMKIFGVRVA
ncbi:asparagine synthase (glutamine-hydrolyzing) [Methanoculleus sp. FWC-SCC1]|uniref:Putative asparagine synthetase [glutamine-hydrolyzing] n=1 Tax=Methanoculleus frigidifontis TaxID=2584085 RepID=A0ABT8M7N8_9EURY|nr:asparagine synthase (glutamine-hydrolyzing) [Methanoculleus sp. FWC-SCC1]MDN7023948.1 asparagine synthase (glutamine-hydrolyzing) [Methanoculleus sp. FWC-SCC1]